MTAMRFFPALDTSNKAASRECESAVQGEIALRVTFRGGTFFNKLIEDNNSLTWEGNQPPARDDSAEGQLNSRLSLLGKAMALPDFPHANARLRVDASPPLRHEQLAAKWIENPNVFKACFPYAFDVEVHTFRRYQFERTRLVEWQAKGLLTTDRE